MRKPEVTIVAPFCSGASHAYAMWSVESLTKKGLPCGLLTDFELDGGEDDQADDDRGQPFVARGQAAIATELVEGALHRPAPG